MTGKSSVSTTSRTYDRTAKVSYPYHPLSICVEIARGVKEIGNGKQDVSRSFLASHLKVDEKSGDFAQKLASTKCYGLIDGRSEFKLTELSRALFFPTEDAEKQRRVALLKAARIPGAFAALLDRYDGSRPPKQELIGNVLAQEFGIPESWKLRIATFFMKAMETSGALSQDGFLRHKAELERVTSGRDDTNGGSDPEPYEGRGSQNESNNSHQRRSPPSPENQNYEDREGVVVWKYPFKGKILSIETPENIPKELCERLKRYIDVLAPTE